MMLKLQLDAVGTVTYAAGYSAANPVERGMAVLSYWMAGRVFGTQPMKDDDADEAMHLAAMKDMSKTLSGERAGYSVTCTPVDTAATPQPNDYSQIREFLSSSRSKTSRNPALNSIFEEVQVMNRHIDRRKNMVLIVRCSSRGCSVCDNLPAPRATKFLGLLHKSKGFFTPTPVGTPDESTPVTPCTPDKHSDSDSGSETQSILCHSQVADDAVCSDDEANQQVAGDPTLSYETFLQSLERTHHAPPDTHRPTFKADLKCSVCGVLCFTKGDLHRHRTMFHPSKRGRKSKEEIEKTSNQKCAKRKRVAFESSSNEERLNKLTVPTLKKIAEQHNLHISKYGTKKVITEEMASHFDTICDTVEAEVSKKVSKKQQKKEPVSAKVDTRKRPCDSPPTQPQKKAAVKKAVPKKARTVIVVDEESSSSSEDTFYFSFALKAQGITLRVYDSLHTWKNGLPLKTVMQKIAAKIDHQYIQRFFHSNQGGVECGYIATYRALCHQKGENIPIKIADEVLLAWARNEFGCTCDKVGKLPYLVTDTVRVWATTNNVSFLEGFSMLEAMMEMPRLPPTNILFLPGDVSLNATNIGVDGHIILLTCTYEE